MKPALLLVALLLSLSSQAQPPDPLPVLRYGETLTGTLNDAAPAARFTFDGRRGEYLSVQLNVTSGTLDPVLALTDASGTPVLVRDDADGALGVAVPQLRLPVSGRYTLVVGRFGYGLGTTSGGFALTVDRIGVSPESGSALRYGDTVANRITDDQPEVFYSFQAQRGDLVTLTMRQDAGSLDPVLRVVSADRRILAENDDAEGSINARIERLPILDDGQYLIIATRYGQTTGSFLLTLQRADDSGLGRSVLTAVPLASGAAASGQITDAAYEVFYNFTAQADDVVDLRMNRSQGGALDSLLEVRAPDQTVIAVNDDVADGNQNAAITGLRLPQSGTYTVIATRYQRAEGTTSGPFTLAYTNQGNAYAAADPAARVLTAGGSATGYLDATTPSLRYVFYSAGGVQVQASMNRGEGDYLPLLTLTRADGSVLASSAGGSPNARLDGVTLDAPGLYYFTVQRVNEAGAGSFFLTYSERSGG